MRILVVGAGAMGSAACYHLARRGAQVVAFEQFPLGHDRGSSHGESRLIRQAYFEHPDYVPLLRRAYTLWEELERESEASLFERCGLAIFGPSRKHGLLAAVSRSAHQYGVPVEEWDEAGARERFPWGRVPEGFEAVWEPGAGWLRVEACVRAHYTRARAMGAEIHENEAVVSWTTTAQGVRVVTRRGQWEGDGLVIAAGAWSVAEAAKVGVALNVHENGLFWATPPRPAPDYCFAFAMPEGFFYGFPPSDQGMKVARHLPGKRLARPDLRRGEPEAAERAAVEKFSQRIFGPSSLPFLRSTTCLYTMSPDEHFIVDRLPGDSRVVLAAGFSGHGFKLSPVIGEILAHYCLTETPYPEAEFLRLNRFGR